MMDQLLGVSKECLFEEVLLTRIKTHTVFPQNEWIHVKRDFVILCTGWQPSLLEDHEVVEVF